ncbi:helix-turn-helix transcriptional regulator [Maribacter dokdonensis]|uniref:helix-turn-helix transcriptional regulator n=1 Tax=Maribacter dokdonensis TaxID=320912 RepID=UPI002734B478|nr:helix-turn-helix transcriptional regulator [Maribacter dokdonensis]MDP2526259.1 helix-turn-helix transcriptional regulator [Maribacter dokdonensis]
MKIPVLHISQFLKNKPLHSLYVNSFADHIQINKNLINKPHSHNFYLCVIFTKGTGTHEIDFDTYPIEPGKVFFLKPGQTHFWKFESQPEGYIFFHSQEFYELKFLDHSLNSFPFYYSNQNPPLLQLSKEKLIHLTTVFQELFTEYREENLLREAKIISLIHYIYIELTRAYTADTIIEKLGSNSYANILERLEKLINAHFYTEKLPKFYAEKLSITTKHLNRVVQKTISKTTTTLISERITLEAKRLIVHSNDNLANVADTLGYSDYAYFSKFFKSNTGMTPMEFRKIYFH